MKYLYTVGYYDDYNFNLYFTGAIKIAKAFTKVYELQRILANKSRISGFIKWDSYIPEIRDDYRYSKDIIAAWRETNNRLRDNIVIIRTTNDFYQNSKIC